jgi:Na+-exporting ATPase
VDDFIVGLAFRTDGVAVYPISPVAALWVNTISAGPPALALGIEGTDKNAMSTPPDEFQSIFTPSWFLDTIFYGVIIGAQVIANYVIVLYGYANGEEDFEAWCNDSHAGLQDGCHHTFRARGAAFATILILLMVHAFTVSATRFWKFADTDSSFKCKHRTRSIFRMNLGDNRLLLWSVATLSLTVFP